MCRMMRVATSRASTFGSFSPATPRRQVLEESLHSSPQSRTTRLSRPCEPCGATSRTAAVTRVRYEYTSSQKAIPGEYSNFGRRLPGLCSVFPGSPNCTLLGCIQTRQTHIQKTYRTDQQSLEPSTPHAYPLRLFHPGAPSSWFAAVLLPASEGEWLSTITDAQESSVAARFRSRGAYLPDYIYVRGRF